MKPLQKYCSKGHDMSITRRRTPGGKTYCNECKNHEWRSYDETSRLRNRAKQLKKRYKITLTEYNNMLHAQGNVCAICKSPDIKRNESNHFHIDHCHTSGAVRGLLCNKCNRGLGFFEDNPDLLKTAAAYLIERGYDH